jgi:phosphate transport system substrate-binding protein
MPIRVMCPQCQARYKVADETAGLTATCARCRAPIPIPARQTVGVGASDRPSEGALSTALSDDSAVTQITQRLDVPVEKPDRWNLDPSRPKTRLGRSRRDRTSEVLREATGQYQTLLSRVLFGSMALNAILAVTLALVVLRTPSAPPGGVDARAAALLGPAREPPAPLQPTVDTLPPSLPAATLPAAPKRLMGSGSSFVNPLMQDWLSVYDPRDGSSVSYLSAGSGKGIENLLANSSHFACSDAPMSASQLDLARSRGSEVLHIPLAMGAVVAGYNLPGEPQLKFTGPLLADIYLGRITRWNDPALLALNPGVTLPDQPIVVVYRSDKSGTSYLWTDYLSKVSSDWKAAVGVGTEVKWPCGEGRPQNEGIANFVKRTDGALGYFELSFALANRLRCGKIKNRAGEFVEPSLASTTAAAAGLAHLPDDLCFSLTDSEGREAYPICGAVWAILLVEQPAEQGTALVSFLRWITHEGQSRCASLNYASLPEMVVKQIDRKLALVKTRP